LGERTRVIVTSAGKILLVKDWLGDGSWSLPGGGLHRGEEAMSGAVRELWEETGLRVTVTELRFLGQMNLRGHGFSIVGNCYRLKLSSPKLLKPRGGEILEACWLPIQAIYSKSDISDNTRQVIERWRDQL